MSWQNLLEKDEIIALPWLGRTESGRNLRSGTRVWRITGDLPPEPGWYAFQIRSRTAVWKGYLKIADLEDARGVGFLQPAVRGFLVGDRLILEDTQTGRTWCPKCHTASADADHSRFKNRECPICQTPVVALERVHLLEPLDRFSYIQAARFWPEGPLVYLTQLLTFGPEPAVQAALDDGQEDLAAVPGVTPALETAFRFELWRRAEVRRRRAEAERARRQAELARQLGTAEGRREMARHDFEAAARAALTVGGATYLDHRQVDHRGHKEMVVRFRFLDRRFECVCDQALRIIDAGICLVDHETDERGDTYFTLESLPAVIREADRDGKLVQFRHVG